MARSVMALYRADRNNNNNNNNIEEANEVLARFVPRQRGRSSRETQRAPYFAREREQRLAFFLDGGEDRGGRWQPAPYRQSLSSPSERISISPLFASFSRILVPRAHPTFLSPVL